MTTRAEMLGKVRQELGDGGPQYVWADGLLQEYLVEGLREWSLVRPVERTVTLPGVAGQRDFVLPQDVIPNGLMTVAWPVGVVVPMGATAAALPRSVWEVSSSMSLVWFYDQAYEIG